MAEVERLHQLGVHNVFLVDDNFIGHRGRAREFLLELYEGYRGLLERLYSHRNYRRRAMAWILGRGKTVQSGFHLRRDELKVFMRFVRDCLLRGGLRRRLLTLSMLLETAVRKPARLRDAVTLALMHKHFYEYVSEL